MLRFEKSGTSAFGAAIRRVGEAQVGDRTPVDALAPAVEAAPQGLDAAARALQEGADRTADLRADGAGELRRRPPEGRTRPGPAGIALFFRASAAVAGPGVRNPGHCLRETALSLIRCQRRCRSCTCVTRPAAPSAHRSRGS
ncbi:DAK2 domain-containing protein [Pseudonocardia halophobica]|uniref:DAK2 domain-containing protein n=1 Tax=Pseudonocardia halophobica TaxID=29401 RepID=UPI003D91AF1C